MFRPEAAHLRGDRVRPGAALVGSHLRGNRVGPGPARRPAPTGCAPQLLAREEYVRHIGNRCDLLKRHQPTRSLIIYAQRLESVTPN
jgi:hypothetical protein